MPILELQEVEYFYRKHTKKRYILRNINYSFTSATWYSILGEPNSGKSTLLALLSKLDTPKGGRLLYKNTDIQTLPEPVYYRRVHTIFKDYNLISYLTVMENIIDACIISNIKEDKEHILSIAKELDINEDIFSLPASKLSTSQQYLIAILRAIIVNVDILFVDNVYATLEKEAIFTILSALHKATKNYHLCVIMFTDTRAIAQKSDTIILLHKGRIK